jgi:glutamine amidotransferase
VAEFLAIQQSDASLLGCLLRKYAGRLDLGSAEQAAGVGFFQSDDLLLRKRPLAGQPAQPERLADGVESEAVLVCSGAVDTSGTPGRSFREERTLPFRFKRWLFALAGNLDALTPGRAELEKQLPDYLRRSAKGDSAAEALFLTFLAKLREAGRLDDFNVDAQTAARALAAAVGVAERACETNGAAPLRLAAVVINGRVMAALRRGHPLWLGSIEGLVECARCELAPGASELSHLLRAHRALRATALFSGEIAPEGFRAVADGEIIAIPRDLEARSL